MGFEVSAFGIWHGACVSVLKCVDTMLHFFVFLLLGESMRVAGRVDEITHQHIIIENTQINRKGSRGILLGDFLVRLSVLEAPSGADAKKGSGD